MVRKHGHLDTEETNEAAWVATWGALAGAARVSLISALYSISRSRDLHCCE